jgi:hypothetical protein
MFTMSISQAAVLMNSLLEPASTLLPNTSCIQTLHHYTTRGGPLSQKTALNAIPR